MYIITIDCTGPGKEHVTGKTYSWSILNVIKLLNLLMRNLRRLTRQTESGLSKGYTESEIGNAVISCNIIT